MVGARLRRRAHPGEGDRACGTDVKAICAALSGLTHYPGITGRITKFNKGEVTKPVQIQVIKDGKVRSLATIDNPEVITPPVE
jgi:hypothetical protein